MVNGEKIGELKGIAAVRVEYFPRHRLNYYNLDQERNVGKRGTTYTVREGIQDFDKGVGFSTSSYIPVDSPREYRRILYFSCQHSPHSCV